MVKIDRKEQLVRATGTGIWEVKDDQLRITITQTNQPSFKFKDPLIYRLLERTDKRLVLEMKGEKIALFRVGGASTLQAQAPTTPPFVILSRGGRLIVENTVMLGGDLGVALHYRQPGLANAAVEWTHNTLVVGSPIALFLDTSPAPPQPGADTAAKPIPLQATDNLLDGQQQSWSFSSPKVFYRCDRSRWTPPTPRTFWGGSSPGRSKTMFIPNRSGCWRIL